MFMYVLCSWSTHLDFLLLLLFLAHDPPSHYGYIFVDADSKRRTSASKLSLAFSFPHTSSYSPACRSTCKFSSLALSKFSKFQSRSKKTITTDAMMRPFVVPLSNLAYDWWLSKSENAVLRLPVRLRLRLRLHYSMFAKLKHTIALATLPQQLASCVCLVHWKRVLNYFQLQRPYRPCEKCLCLVVRLEYKHQEYKTLYLCYLTFRNFLFPTTQSGRVSSALRELLRRSIVLSQSRPYPSASERRHQRTWSVFAEALMTCTWLALVSLHEVEHQNQYINTVSNLVERAKIYRQNNWKIKF